MPCQSHLRTLLIENKLLDDKPKYQKQLYQNITIIVIVSATINTIGIDKKFIELQQIFVKKGTNKETYNKKLYYRFLESKKRWKTSMDTVYCDEQ